MSNYDALFEDEDDIIFGTPQKRFWDIFKQIEEDKREKVFDNIVAKTAAMELMLIEKFGAENLENVIKSYLSENEEEMTEQKKSLYLEYGSKLIYTFTS
ncbi:MAG: hypothetical protein RL113_520 [Pseudomonadota bacterium]|jgi:hypothetical protein